MERRHLVLSAAYSLLRRLVLLAVCLMLSVAVAARVSQERDGQPREAAARAAAASHAQHVQAVATVAGPQPTYSPEAIPPVPVWAALVSILVGCVTVVGWLVHRHL